jgi:hypothetical protein
MLRAGLLGRWTAAVSFVEAERDRGLAKAGGGLEVGECDHSLEFEIFAATAEE